MKSPVPIGKAFLEKGIRLTGFESRGPQPMRTRVERQRALERGLIRVRWFGVAFAFFQVFMGADPACPPGAKLADLTNPVTRFTPGCEPGFLRPLGYGLALAIAAINVAILLLLRRARDEKSLERLGVTAFLADHLVLIAYTWLYSFTLETSIWVVLYILPLEGALRYGMRGSLMSLWILSASEIAREAFRQQMWGYPFNLVPDVTFRVGIMTIIGVVAGMMARNLEREHREVERKAIEASALAEAEAASRREVEAFHQATIAGVSTGDLGEALQRMTDVVGEMFGYESLAMALLDGPASKMRLTVVAGYQFPREAIGRTVTLDEGLSGPVARTGKPVIVNDVSHHPTYLDWAPWCLSEMVVPLKIGDRIIGVLIVESPRENAFSEEDLERLVRLSIPIAVVVENAKILAQQKETVERLTQLDEMKSDFIAITSHELRTPLTSILGFLKTMRRPDVDLSEEDRANYLRIVEAHSQRLLEVVEDLLFVSQIEQGAIEVRRSSFDLVELVREVVSERLPDQLRRIKIHGDAGAMVSDRDRLKRVAFSLIENAVKFSPPTAEIRVTVESGDTSVRLEVRDDGVGIPQREIDMIFERFYQVGGSMRRSQPGFGLGLYVTKRIVDSLGGEIRVASVPGKGSVFVVDLPCREVEPAQSAAS